MLIDDRIVLVAEILGEDLAADGDAGQELYEALLPYVAHRPARPQEVVFDMDEPAPVWRSKRREVLRRAFALKRGLPYEDIKHLSFRELAKMIPDRAERP
ncbi:MAG: hypothetical protein ACE5FC_05875 [Myxococcota bacterium]